MRTYIQGSTYDLDKYQTSSSRSSSVVRLLRANQENTYHEKRSPSGLLIMLICLCIPGHGRRDFMPGVPRGVG